MDINKLYENYQISKSCNLNGLLKLIEEEINNFGSLLTEIEAPIEAGETSEERVIRFPAIKITENWGVKNTEDRAILETLMKNVEGGTVEAKLASVNDFMDYQPGLPVPKILSNLIFLQIFSNIIEEYNASTAGFLFEAFLAGLFLGEQIQDPEQVGAEAGSLPIEDVNLMIRRAIQAGDDADVEEAIVPYSLKVLSPGSDLKGSFKNLVDFFVEGRSQKIIYLVVTKMGAGTLAFNEFDITSENFLDYIGHEEFKMQHKIAPVEFTFGVDEIPAANIRITTGAAMRAKIVNGEVIFRPPTRPKGRFMQYDEIEAEEIIVQKINPTATSDEIALSKISGGGEVRLNPEDLLITGEAYKVNARVGEKEYTTTGQRTASSKALYGKEEDLYSQLKTMERGPEFWEAIMQSPGYVTKKQFHIAPGYFRKQSREVGVLDLYPPKLIQIANQYAKDLSNNLIAIYNSLSSLSSNINKFFLDVDEGEMSRNQHGMGAVKDAGRLNYHTKKAVEATE